jgi:hypothetical protein
MLKKVLALTTAATFLAGAALASSPDKDKKAKKLTDVTVCPMTGEAVKGEGGGSEVVGKYKVHFCCNGCQPNFDKLSKKDQQKKIADALKKQKSSKKS